MNTIGPDPSGASTTPSEAVLESVADHRDVEPFALPPLYEVLDPDALDGLFADGVTPADGTVTFTYADCTVEVSGNGTVSVSGSDA